MCPTLTCIKLSVLSTLSSELHIIGARTDANFAVMPNISGFPENRSVKGLTPIYSVIDLLHFERT